MTELRGTPRSFRGLLGLRVTVAMTAAMGAVSILSFLALRLALDRGSGTRLLPTRSAMTAVTVGVISVAAAAL